MDIYNILLTWTGRTAYCRWLFRNLCLLLFNSRFSQSIMQLKSDKLELNKYLFNLFIYFVNKT